jgi:hypothetical protein
MLIRKQPLPAASEIYLYDLANSIPQAIFVADGTYLK